MRIPGLGQPGIHVTTGGILGGGGEGAWPDAARSPAGKETCLKELEWLQQIEEDFNQFLGSQGKEDRVYLVAYKAGEPADKERQPWGKSTERPGPEGHFHGPHHGPHHGRGCCP